MVCSPPHGYCTLARGIGKFFKFGNLPVNAQFGVYYNMVRPDIAYSWQIRAQMQFKFPK